MPLALGDVSTESPQFIVFDPEVESERRDALSRYRELRRRGFIRKAKHAGRIELVPPKRNPKLGLFRVLSQNGDDRIVWDRTKLAEVKDARAMFKDFIAKGYKAYAVIRDDSGDQRRHELDTFDPSLEEVLFVPSKDRFPG